MKERELSVFEKLVSGYDPKLTKSDLMHLEDFGVCNTECTDTMKSMGMCTCWNIECEKRNAGSSVSMSSRRVQKSTFPPKDFKELNLTPRQFKKRSA